MQRCVSRPGNDEAPRIDLHLSKSRPEELADAGSAEPATTLCNGQKSTSALSYSASTITPPWLALVASQPYYQIMAPKFVSLGMVVLDELRFPHAATMHDVPGGSGPFSTLGARLVAGTEKAHEVGCAIMAGEDFPETALAQFESWGVDLVVSRKPGRRSTRGLLVYEDREFGSKSTVHGLIAFVN